MLQNNKKTAEVLKAEKIVEQAKARLAEAKRKASQQKRKEENQHKYMMGGIVHKYFPECYPDLRTVYIQIFTIFKFNKKN